MMQKVRKRLRRILPWFFLLCLLSGCGNGLWRAAGILTEEPQQATQWLTAGWTLNQSPVSAMLWNLLTGTIPTNPYYQMISGFPVLQEHAGKPTMYVTEEEAFYAEAWVSDSWKHRFEKVKELTLSEEVQVLLYHTHNAETYLPSAGVSKVSGQNGGVVQAAQVFQQALQQNYGIRTIHNTTLHDYPNWNKSYQNSLSSVQQLLKVNPEVQAVFDIHRDAGFTSKAPTTATINGKKAARIMLVIGANHDNWKENLAFAQALEEACDRLYPGLLRDKMHIKETGRYNQQVHPHAVLLEIGSDLNTQEEADYAMECFAQVVYEVLRAQDEAGISG